MLKHVSAFTSQQERRKNAGECIRRCLTVTPEAVVTCIDACESKNDQFAQCMTRAFLPYYTR